MWHSHPTPQDRTCGEEAKERDSDSQYAGLSVRSIRRHAESLELSLLALSEPGAVLLSLLRRTKIRALLDGQSECERQVCRLDREIVDSLRARVCDPACSTDEKKSILAASALDPTERKGTAVSLRLGVAADALRDLAAKK